MQWGEVTSGVDAEVKTDEENADRVVVDQPERQNLLGLLMQNILAANLADEAKYARVRTTKADIQVQAGEMIVTLRLDDGKMTIIEGPTESPKASVRGDMAALLSVASGGGIVGPFFRGDVRASGNVLLLLKILPLIRRPIDSSEITDRTEDSE